MPDKLHVCHLGKYYPPAPGGIETHVQTLARAQAELGADVRVLCVNHVNRSGRDVTLARYGASSTVHDTDGPEGAAVRITRLGRSATVARLDICPDLPRAIDDLFKHPVDVLHLHTPNPTMMLAITRLRKSAPIVITHHSDIIKQKLLRHILNPFEKLVYSRAAKILATNEPYIDGSPLLKQYRSKVQVLPMGLDLSPMVQPNEAALARAAAWKARYREPIWLFVGRCVYYKGLETAIAALPHVPGTLVIIGTGPMESALKEQAAKLSVSDRIVWRGYADVDELIGAYLAATALWFPSTHRSEAYGLVQVEAMAAGCPVINTNLPHSGVAWVSPHEVSGLTIPVGNAAALAAASNRIINEAGLRDRLSAGAKARALAEFDHRVMAARSLDVYRQVCSDRTARLGGRLDEWVRGANQGGFHLNDA